MAAIQLVKKKSARYPENYTLRVSTEAKDMATEMADDDFEVAESLRELFETGIRELYKQYEREKAKASD